MLTLSQRQFGKMNFMPDVEKIAQLAGGVQVWLAFDTERYLPPQRGLSTC